ncbi:MAG: hypothetical protein AAF639_00990 [Chloroflexota bacterium]
MGRIKQMIASFIPVRNAYSISDKLELKNTFQKYYLNGYLQNQFTDETSLNRLNTVLAELYSKEPKGDFKWEQKYKYSQDFRPNVFGYDPIFLDILFENNIPQLLKETTGFDLYLVNLQLRLATPGPSYMNWHRDTHIYGDKIVGNYPPVHKIIFYPNLGESPRPQLYVSRGSHNRTHHNRIRDMGQIWQSQQDTIFSSDNSYLLFNTSLLHAVLSETNEKGSLRLIYSFAHKFQLDTYQGDLSDEYQERLASM